MAGGCSFAACLPLRKPSPGGAYGTSSRTCPAGAARLPLAVVLRDGPVTMARDAQSGEDRLMTSRIAAMAIDARQPHVVADFWCAVLDWRVIDVEENGISIGPPDSSWPTIDVFSVPEPKTVKNRLHLDLRADGLRTSAELQRLLDLGASRVDVGQATDVSWVVLADPEGNEFCLLARSVQEL